MVDPPLDKEDSHSGNGCRVSVHQVKCVLDVARGDSTPFDTWQFPVLRLANLPPLYFLPGHCLVQNCPTLWPALYSEWQTAHILVQRYM